MRPTMLLAEISLCRAAWFSNLPAAWQASMWRSFPCTDHLARKALAVLHGPLAALTGEQVVQAQCSMRLREAHPAHAEASDLGSE